MGNGHGYGKTILFGEHFVVYGLPALASAIGARTTALVERASGSGYALVDHRPEVPGYKTEKFDEQQASIKNILHYMGVDATKQKIKITFGGDLVAASGVGASAASCVALARALNEEFKLGWDDARINDAAYEGEKGYHGIPSGIDNTASTFGGLVYFVKNMSGGPNTMDTIRIPKPVELVIGSSGVTSDTKDVVADVKKLKDAKPDWFAKITRTYQQLVKDGCLALKNMDLKRVGTLFDQNHALLQELTVSSKVLDQMVAICKDAGAFGAKVTGTGRGGNMIALTPGKALQDKVAKALENESYTIWKTVIGI